MEVAKIWFYWEGRGFFGGSGMGGRERSLRLCCKCRRSAAYFAYRQPRSWKWVSKLKSEDDSRYKHAAYRRIVRQQLITFKRMENASVALFGTNLHIDDKKTRYRAQPPPKGGLLNQLGQLRSMMIDRRSRSLSPPWSRSLFMMTGPSLSSVAVLVDNNRPITVAIPVTVVRPDCYATKNQDRSRPLRLRRALRCKYPPRQQSPQQDV